MLQLPLFLQQHNGEESVFYGLDSGAFIMEGNCVKSSHIVSVLVREHLP